MSSIQDLLSDITSIVTSVHFGELMTLKRIEEDYRAIYGTKVPFEIYGFSSLHELLEKFPDHFQLLFNNNGLMYIRTKIRNKITALISKEKRTNKPKNFVNNSKRTLSMQSSKPRIYSSTQSVSMNQPPSRPSPAVKSIEILKILLSTKTGYNISDLQGHLFSITGTDRSQFANLINEAHQQRVLSYDHELIYGFGDRQSLRTDLYPKDVCVITIVQVTSPSDFLFEIVTNDNMPTRKQLHADMQRMAPNQQLLSMFTINRHCSLLHEGEWVRGRVLAVEGKQAVVRLEDSWRPMEVRVPLPTERLRFQPPECEVVPARAHRGSLAFVSPLGGYWDREAIDILAAMITDRACVYRCFLAGSPGDTIPVDIVVCSPAGDRWSLFQRLLQAGVALSTPSDL